MLVCNLSETANGTDATSEENEATSEAGSEDASAGSLSSEEIGSVDAGGDFVSPLDEEASTVVGASDEPAETSDEESSPDSKKNDSEKPSRETAKTSGQKERTDSKPVEEQLDEKKGELTACSELRLKFFLI